MCTGSFPEVKYGRGVLLTTHHLRVPGHGRVELYLYPPSGPQPGLQRENFTFTPYQIHVLFYVPSPFICFPSLTGSRVFVLWTTRLQVKIIVDCVRTYCIVSRGRSLWRLHVRHLISFHWLSCGMCEPIFQFSKWAGGLIFTTDLLLPHMRKISVSKPETGYPVRGRWPQSLEAKTVVVTK